MTYATTITTKGQVTIPNYFRQQLQLQTGDKVAFQENPYSPNELILKPISNFASLQGALKTSKKYHRTAARRAFIKDVLTNKV